MNICWDFYIYFFFIPVNLFTNTSALFVLSNTRIISYVYIYKYVRFEKKKCNYSGNNRSVNCLKIQRQRITQSKEEEKSA